MFRTATVTIAGPSVNPIAQKRTNIFVARQRPGEVSSPMSLNRTASSIASNGVVGIKYGKSDWLVKHQKAGMVITVKAAIPVSGSEKIDLAPDKVGS